MKIIILTIACALFGLLALMVGKNNQSLVKELTENQTAIDTLTLQIEEKQSRLDFIKQSIEIQRDKGVTLNKQINIHFSTR